MKFYYFECAIIDCYFEPWRLVEEESIEHDVIYNVAHQIDSQAQPVVYKAKIPYFKFLNAFGADVYIVPSSENGTRYVLSTDLSGVEAIHALMKSELDVSEIETLEIELTGHKPKEGGEE